MPFKVDPVGDAGLSASDADEEDGDAPASELACDVSKPFGAPIFVGGLSDVTGQSLSGLRLSPDYLTGYYSANYQPNSGGSNELYTATRATLVSAFQTPTPLQDTQVSPTDYVTDPTVSRDGLEVLFGWAPLGLSQHISYATRNTTSVAFSYLGAVPNVNDPAGEDASPFLREDGQVLYFSSSRVSANSDDIFQAAWNGSSFAAPAAVDELNTTFSERSPVVTPDDRTIFFASARPDVNARGNMDIWMATRPSPGAPFSTPTIVTELNTPNADLPTFVTRDACTLYFSVAATSTDAVHAEYFAQRPAP
jgi:hypothetical protein